MTGVHCLCESLAALLQRGRFSPGCLCGSGPDHPRTLRWHAPLLLILSAPVTGRYFYNLPAPPHPLRHRRGHHPSWPGCTPPEPPTVCRTAPCPPPPTCTRPRCGHLTGWAPLASGGACPRRGSTWRRPRQPRRRPPHKDPSSCLASLRREGWTRRRQRPGHPKWLQPARLGPHPCKLTAKTCRRVAACRFQPSSVSPFARV